ncbi:MAG TPA: bifunctional phosphoribosylaminoimidazolecarboxamide formyltransferase/IMP cyclohydrolase [Candidatus Omnitrophota bacterium]|nr:bifunctional phosphoribosylaminoimidazolecarboxamide formyltransferase/IMP cyclohydrolase [Candidatus Omnitrophota bacterium]HPN88310.1 bifunctional phosphoribosylaminoimidazolecarboxamide formyltransferase/IMP cyclohydrolase [Candidatus Omnitrophota bacterium]
MIKVKRALISVSDKKGLVAFVRGLVNLGVEIISTGGTAKQLRDAGFVVKEVSEHTGFPEMLDGRVKTLHPKIHGGLLAVRDNPEHMKQVKDHQIELIDMVVVNLYPFESVTAKKNVSLEEAIENIDIGGPSMLRSAAKNFKSVAVVCNPDRYEDVLKELQLNSGILSDTVLFSLAVEVFQRTAGYDQIISEFLAKRLSSEEFGLFAKNFSLKFSKVQDLRYGENPHQKAAFYRDYHKEFGFGHMKQLHGKELSFNNILDLNAAVDFVKGFFDPAAVIIKHNNPTGVSENKSLVKAYQEAFACDPLSAFGGIIGLNKAVDEKTAVAISKSGFMECVIAPSFEKKAIEILGEKKNLRLIEFDFNGLEKEEYDFKKVYGGLLLQQKDNVDLNKNELKIVTKKKPTQAQMDSLLFGWKIVKHVKSNAIVLTKGKKVVGIGCGQTSRVESVEGAIRKAGKQAKGAVLISDAFFPKTDNIHAMRKAGIAAVIQPGGSIADAEIIKEADKAKIAMVFTGIRHFKH